MDFKEFINKYLGMIIGILVAVVLIALGMVYVVECIVLIAVCGYIGKYIQGNKTVVKTKLKDGIDKVFKDDEEE